MGTPSRPRRTNRALVDRIIDNNANATGRRPGRQQVQAFRAWSVGKDPQQVRALGRYLARLGGASHGDASHGAASAVAAREVTGSSAAPSTRRAPVATATTGAGMVAPPDGDATPPFVANDYHRFLAAAQNAGRLGSFGLS